MEPAPASQHPQPSSINRLLEQRQTGDEIRHFSGEPDHAETNQDADTKLPSRSHYSESQK